jgi:hypothetical protein
MPNIRKRVTVDLGTLQGVVVHTGKGGATPQVGLRIGYTFSYIFQPLDNQNLRFSSPFLLQLHLLYKCANTTKCTTSCACVLAFSQKIFKGLALFSLCHLILAMMQS